MEQSGRGAPFPRLPGGGRRSLGAGDRRRLPRRAHPRAEIAEILLQAGSRVEADKIFSALLEECANDVWLYNSAGISYAEARDHEEALRWLDAGIRLVLETLDPEDILGQLMDFRERSMEALGRSPDDELALNQA